jgi:hypothetical protein
MKKFTVVGVREDIWWDEFCQIDKHILSLIDEVGEKFEVSISRETEINVEPFASDFGNYKLERGWCGNPTHEPIDKNLQIELEYPTMDFNWNCPDISNSVFTVSFYGGDFYYPSGGYDINMELFKQI